MSASAALAKDLKSFEGESGVSLSLLEMWKDREKELAQEKKDREKEAKLQVEQRRRAALRATDGPPSAAATGPAGACYRCGVHGHISRNCLAPMAGASPKAAASSAQKPPSAVT